MSRLLPAVAAHVRAIHTPKSNGGKVIPEGLLRLGALAFTLAVPSVGAPQPTAASASPLPGAHGFFNERAPIGSQFAPNASAVGDLLTGPLPHGMGPPSMAGVTASKEKGPHDSALWTAETNSPQPTLSAVQAASWMESIGAPIFKLLVSPENRGLTITSVEESDSERDGLVDHRFATMTAYDQRGRVVKAVRDRDFPAAEPPIHQHEAEAYEFDARGNPARVEVDYGGRPTVILWRHDEYDNVVEQTYDSGSDGTIDGRTTYSRTYENGRLVQTTTEFDFGADGVMDGRATHRVIARDPWGNVCQSVFEGDDDADGVTNSRRTFRAEYDQGGNVLHATWEADYTADGIVDARIRSEAQYDQHRAIVSWSNRFAFEHIDGVVVQSETGASRYDDQGRLLHREYRFENSFTVHQMTESHVYDARGNLTRTVLDNYHLGEVYARQIISSDYDRRGNRTRQMSEFDLSPVDGTIDWRFAIACVHDANGNVVRSAYELDFDGDGTFDPGSVSVLEYDQHDNLLRMIQDEATLADGTVVFSNRKICTYDRTGLAESGDANGNGTVDVTEDAPTPGRGGAAFALWPVNPSRGALKVRFSLPGREEATLEAFDVSGRRMESREVSVSGSGWQTANLGPLPAGLYMVRLSGRDGSLTRRVMVVR